MKLFMENGIEELAKLSMEEIDKEKSSKDDIDVRLKWLGLLHRRKHRQILKSLAEVGLTGLQSGMDNVRNPVGNPLAGIDPDEIVDTGPYTNLLSQFITSNSRGNPAFTNLEVSSLLPRKWNVCVVGSHDLYEHPHINDDLAYVPPLKDLRFGFNFLVGGLLSPKRRAEAVPLDAWVSADDVLPVCRAVLEAYIDLGFRGNRQKTRMMW
ncbi:hypothetical protein Peur_073648 [Populus x canadensis]